MLFSDFITDCPNARDEQICADCTFEDDTCRWLDVSDGTFAWARDQGMNVVPVHAGPAIDRKCFSTCFLCTEHTWYLDTTQTDRGYYMYVRVNEGVIWDEAILELQQILQPSSANCELEFYHHAIDDHTLSVHLVEGEDSIKIWEERRALGDQWIRVILPIGRVARPWRIQFQAEKGWGTGAVALDDVRLVGCQFPPVRPNCTTDQFRCNRGACIPKENVCDFT